MFLSVRAAAAGLIAVTAIAASNQLLADALAPTSALSETVSGAAVTTAVFKAPDASVTDLKPTAAADGAQATPTSLDLLVRAAMTHRDAPVDTELECMAKAIHHEAANQPLKGQLAVGQVIRNRSQSGRFPKSFCAVVNQRGQFFSTARYAVSGDKRWQTALAVARLAEQQSTPQVAPGALYFHAAYVRPAWTHHRQMVTQIGAHLFYR
ncbi:cell wall hydrolase [Caulobacter sp. KR2-114]|uniref:cell wall hydrolase n=1 Tax=Caulobacter sp. KR2-114 TaxID=3400912 RepID=UPI003C0EA4D3